MSEFYILVGKEAKPVSGSEWSQWYESADRQIGQTCIGDQRVSTVFLGIDHSFGGDKPLLFETMIFGGDLDGYQERCETYDEAVIQHQAAVNAVNVAMGIKP